MNVKTEVMEKNTAKLTIEVPAEEFDKATVAAYNKQKNRISIPGFRKGKAPKNMIEKIYGEGIFWEEAVNSLIDETWPKAADESGLEIVSRPEINVEAIKKGEPFVYTATVATKPPVELGEYKGVKVERTVTTVTEEDVEKELKRVQEQNSRLVSIEDADREVKKDDTCIINFDGYVDGRAFEGGKGEDYSLLIGSHSFIDTFEDQLIGHKAGEDLDVNVTFPANYHQKDLAGKPALFKVHISEIKEKQLPEIDDEFASEVSEFETLAEYKVQLEKDLKLRKDKAAAQENENRVVDAVVKNAVIDVPKQMIDAQAENMVENYARQMQSQGIPFDQYLKYTGTTAEDMKKSMMEQAEKNIRTSLVIEAIAAKENIKAADEAVDAQIEQMAKNYKMEPEKLRELMGEAEIDSIRREITFQDVIDMLVAEAELTEAKAE